MSGSWAPRGRGVGLDAELEAEGAGEGEGGPLQVCDLCDPVG